LSLSFLIFGPFSPASNDSLAESAGVLRNIILSKSQDKLEVTLLISSYSSSNIFGLRSPNRIVLDLYEVYEIRAQRMIEVNEFGLLRIRTGRFTAGVVRVVFDVEDAIPFYDTEKISDGLRLTFRLKETSGETMKPVEIKTEEAEKISEEKAEQKIEVKAKEEVEKKAEEVGQEKAEEGKEIKEAEERRKEEESSAVEIKEQLDETRKELEEAKKKLEETVTILNKLSEDRAKQKKKFFRVMAIGNYFSPREGVLKDVYQSGMMFGAELDIGVADFVEVWLTESYFGKKVINVQAGEERKVKVIPLEAGFKFRLNKGIVNPYFGIGGGYFQYREESLSGEIKEEQIGFIAQTGFFVKIGTYFVFNFCVQFKYCPIETKAEKFDIGGFHFGGGLGIEF